MTASNPDPAQPAGAEPTGRAGPEQTRAAGPEQTSAAGPELAEATWFEPGPPTAEEMAEQEAILAEQIAVGLPELPPDELSAFLPDPDTGPPVGRDEGRLAELPSPVLETLLDERAAAAAAAEASAPFPAEVITHDGTGSGGPGFESGSVLDGLAPGPVLTAALDDTWQSGYERLSDDQLAGVMLASRRLESRGAAGLLAATAELSRRREASGDRQVIEHIDNEIAILLTLTRRSARTLLEFADSLARLPATTGALAAGRIDRAKADLIAYETGLLDPQLAAAVEQLVIEDAPKLTTTGLRRRLRHAVIAADPSAARRRVEQAARDARVELSDERSGGTAALAGRDLPTIGALAADQRIDAAARALKAAGVAATLAQLRAAVFLGLLTGSDPLGFLPPPDPEQDTPQHTRPMPAASQSRGPAPDGTDPSAGSAADQPAPDTGSGTGPAGLGSPDDGAGDPGENGPAGLGSPDDGAGDPGGKWPGPGTLRLRGSVHLTMPLTSWLGATRSPGEITGLGPATAETCRDLADWIAENPSSRWCLTLTDKAGHAVGHGCARRAPPPTADTERMAAWLASLKVGPIEAGTCSHAREVPGYRIPDSLHHIVKVRQKSCSNPICATPATRSDDDHTLPHDQGGRTCECGIAPACRTCHRTKQAPGWHLEQPSPGVLIWRPPHGRRYTVTPDVYPT